MRAVQGPCLAGEEALVEVVRGPEVEVTDLRPLDAEDPEEAARPARESCALRAAARSTSSTFCQPSRAAR